MGRAVAEAFARAGYDVALLSREPERLARAAAQLQAAYNMRALAVPTDGPRAPFASPRDIGGARSGLAGPRCAPSLPI